MHTTQINTSEITLKNYNSNDVKQGTELKCVKAFKGLSVGQTLTVSKIVEYRWSNEIYYSCWYASNDIYKTPVFVNIYKRDLVNLKTL